MCLALTALSPALAHAQANPAPTASAAVGAADAPLPELPKLAPITHKEPDPALVQELASLLERFTSEDARTRENARGALSETPSPEMVEAIHARLLELRGAMDRSEAQGILDEARKDARKRKKGKTDDSEDDWLEFLLAKPSPRSRTWRDLVGLYVMIRLLVLDGTTPAMRTMIGTYAYFGDLVRVDLQRQVAKLRDRAVPALIEGRQHDAKIVQRWASRQLDDLGRAIPGEAVSTNDTDVLANVLRAYGRTRDVDALRVILSFTDHDRTELRQASREAVAAIGEPGLWQLRDAYLGMTGEKPPRSYTWDRIAKELFAMHDGARLAEVHAAMDEGVGLAKEGKNAEAVAAFDKVLARVPLYDRRKEMVPAYVAQAASLADKSPKDALVLYRKAFRLDPEGEGAQKLQAEIAYLEGMELIAAGTPDKLILAKALELDPSHEKAKAALAALSDRAVLEAEADSSRYILVGGIGALALGLIVLLGKAFRGRESESPAS